MPDVCHKDRSFCCLPYQVYCFWCPVQFLLEVRGDNIELQALGEIKMTKTAIKNVHGVEDFYVELVQEPDNEISPTSQTVGQAVRSNIPAFASTVQKTKQWVAELMRQMQWDDAQKANHGLRAVLHALRDRLTVKEASDLAAQLPMLIRGMYYEGWQPNHVPVKDRTKEAFLAHVFKDFPNDQSVDPEKLSRAVFQVLRNHVSEGELDDIESILPSRLQDWFRNG